MEGVVPQVVLYNGDSMPQLGLGTFKAKGEIVKQAMRWALSSQYSMIDTASIYRNEREIGEAIKEGEVLREQLFLTSKVSPFEHGFESAQQAVHNIIERLGCGYLDLCLIHWPGVAKLDIKSTKNSEIRRETWRALEQLHKEAKCRAIGVSNYNERHMRELLASCEIKPMVNQVELHPNLQQLHLRKFCGDHHIVVQAYSPLGCGALLNDPTVCEISKSLRVTPAQVLLRWGIQHNLVVLPKSTQERHIKENAGIFSFSLSEKNMSLLNSLERGQHFCWSSEEVC